MQCIHKTTRSGIDHCRLLNRGFLASQSPCSQCQSEWVGGNCPTAETLTPTLIALGSGVSARHAVIRDAASAAASKSTPSRRPHQCDHAGPRLVKGQTCRASIYACDLHGEATCEKCAACPDFVPIEAAT